MPAASLLGGEGQAFAISQTRLGGGRIHHAMRTVGQARKALDMMVERALSRTTQGSPLADKQSAQNYIADSYAELTQSRLFVLYVAWRIDKLKDYRAVRHDIAAIKVLTPKVLHDIAQRSIQVHGALATTNELPLGEMFSGSMILGLADGPSEVHLAGMPPKSKLLQFYAERSGRQLDDFDYYIVLARWKLAIVLEQGYQRAAGDPKLEEFGGYVLKYMREAAETAESSDYAAVSDSRR